MQPVPVGIQHMKLARPPFRVPHGPDVVDDAGVTKLLIESVDIGHHETAGGTFAGRCKLRGVVPLQMQFHIIPPDGGITRVVGSIGKGVGEAQSLVDADRRNNVARHQNRMDGIKTGSHGTLQ